MSAWMPPDAKNKVYVILPPLMNKLNGKLQFRVSFWLDHGCHFCAEFRYMRNIFSVRILRNDKSSLYPKKWSYQVLRMILALMGIVLRIKIMFKPVKLQFI